MAWLVHWVLSDSDVRHILKPGTERRTLCERTLRQAAGWTGRYEHERDAIHEWYVGLGCRTCLRRWIDNPTREDGEDE